MKHSNTAILLFTRNASEEARIKCFVPHGNSLINQSIATGFISRTIRELKKSGYPLFIISSERQVGNSFGERFSNAFTEVFRLGFEQVIAVGNDAPQLNSAVIQHAASMLNEQKLVIGPDKRGGAYLIGLTHSSFDAAALRSIHWNTPVVFSELTDWMFQAAADYSILDAMADINTGSELTSLLQSKILLTRFFQKLRSILASAVPVATIADTCLSVLFSSSAHSRRGPPLFS